MTVPFAYAGFMLAALAMFVLARRCFPSSRSGLDTLPRRERLGLALAAFVGGVLGAKLPFVFVRGADWYGTAWLADGKTVTTGLIGAYVGVELGKLLLGIRVKTGDSFAL
jgi:phosphatidylglycerol---prolipoprotein diacylglyceryl transferase